MKLRKETYDYFVHNHIKKYMKYQKIIRRVCIAVVCICLMTCTFSYDVSARYMKNYPLPELTGNYQKDLIAIAESQLGYRESKTGETIFAAWASQPRLPWCSEFIAWCAHQAEIPTSIIPVCTYAKAYRKFFSQQGRYYIIKNGQSHRACGCKKMAAKTIPFSSIRPGDILLTGSPRDFSDGPGHTCLVISNDGTSLTTIDGNVNKEVWYRTKKPEQIHGVCRPYYNLTKASFTAKVSSKKSVHIAWKKLHNVTGYQIYRSTKKDSGYRLIKTVNKNASSYTDKKLAPNKKYYYKIRAYTARDGNFIYGAVSRARAVKLPG